jgi:hypothetical protein
LSSILPERQRANGHVGHYGVSLKWQLNVTIDRVVCRKVPPETESYLEEGLAGAVAVAAGIGRVGLKS